MIKEVAFDPIFDAQQAFRVLLDAFSHPGTLFCFENYELSQPKELTTSNAIIALSLFDNNISFHSASFYSETVEKYIHLNTSAKIEKIHEADYVFLNGKDSIKNQIQACKNGELSYPEKNATLIISVEQLSVLPIEHIDCHLTLSGPGIQTEQNVFIKGLAIQNIQTLQIVNAEFPLGVDIILTDTFENICAIPRSIALHIIQNN
jgi:alpha-D-ribose 1-methylphosphonate 5-triphosphate synthase subunit PhnH